MIKWLAGKQSQGDKNSNITALVTAIIMLQGVQLNFKKKCSEKFIPR